MSADAILREFARYAAQADQELDLAVGALLVAAHEYPDLDIKSYVKRLDMLASGVAERMPAGAKPEEQISVLNTFLFHERRFRPNTENYYDPRNSYLNDVIDRRCGIPITLCIIYMEIARRLRIPIRGVALPGHFVVKYDRPDLDIYIDCFNAGRVMSSEDCHEMVIRMFGGGFASFGHFLQPVCTRSILIRLLTNLKMIFIHQEDLDRAIRVLDRILLVNPQSVEEFRERGLLHLSLNHYRAALSDLSAYLTKCPDCPDAEFIHHRIDMIITALETQF